MTDKESIMDPENSDLAALEAVGAGIRSAYLKARGGDLTPVPRPPDDKGAPLGEERYAELFRKACSYLGPDIFSEGLLKEVLHYLSANRGGIKYIFPEGYRLAIAVYPTTDLGKTWGKEQIAAAKYLRETCVDSRGLTHHFSLKPGMYDGIQPKAMREACSMPINFKNKDAVICDDDEFVSIHNFYVSAFIAWRKFLGLPDIGLEKYKIT